MNALALGKADVRGDESGTDRTVYALGKEADEILLLVILYIECHIFEVFWEARFD